MPGHVLVGDELDLEIIAAGLPPSDFLGATLPTPPPPPSPTPPQVARSPSPPPITVLETGEPLSAATPSPVPSGRKRAMGKKKRARDPRVPESSSFQREVRKPPIIRIPPVHTRPSAGRDTSQPLRSFPGFRPTGAVVRTLFPPCKHCNNNGRLCTLEANPPLAAKTPRCCSHCKAAHITCPSWTRFSNAFEDGDDEILGEFLVLLWEHLGGGSFLPLEPDPRWSDLTQTRAYGSRSFGVLY
jgi:hypothetical protein